MTKKNNWCFSCFINVTSKVKKNPPKKTNKKQRSMTQVCKFDILHHFKITNKICYFIFNKL